MLSLLILLSLVIISCVPAWGNGIEPPGQQPTSFISETPTGAPTQTLLPGETAVAIPSLTPTLAADAWKSMPVTPLVSAEMVAVYQRGLERGRDPSRFSKIGDCQNITTYFLAEFDTPARYNLGDYAVSSTGDRSFCPFLVTGKPGGEGRDECCRGAKSILDPDQKTRSLQ